MLRRLAYFALPTAVLAVFAAAAPAAADAPDAGDAAQELSGGAVYVEDSITDVFPAAELDALESTAAEAETPTYFLLLPSDTFSSRIAAEGYLSDVADDVGDGNYAMFAGSQGFAAHSTELSARELSQAERAAEDAFQETSGNQIDALAAFGTEAEELASAPPVSGPGAVMLGLLGLAVAGGGYFVYSSSRRRQQREAQELADIKQMASEDVTRLGEDVASLEIDLAKVDDATRQDYTHAMDSYDRAKAALDTIAKPDDVQQITNALEDGRYYMTATRARLNGEPVPPRRSPCFFNPQHGPSNDDVMWAPPGGSARMVPACENCGRAVKTGTNPDVRMVEVDGERRPYYEAGPAFAPYAGGYFGMSMMMGMFSGMMMGSMMGSMMGAGMMGAGMGDGDMGDAGGDMGGGDFDGGGFGDFGGFDF